MALLFLLILLAQVSYFRYILQTIEVIRDPSHVRNYSIKDWVHFIEDAGFELTTLEKQTLKLDFDSWVQRMKTPEDQIKRLGISKKMQQMLLKSILIFKKMEVLKVRSGTLYLKTILLVSLSLDLCS